MFVGVVNDNVFGGKYFVDFCELKVMKELILF